MMFLKFQSEENTLTISRLTDKTIEVPYYIFLAHLVYQPKNLVQLCFVCRRWRWHHHQHWHHRLCTPPPATGLDIEASYLVYRCTYVPIYAHQIFSDSNM